MIARLFVLLAALWLTGCGDSDRDWPAPSPALWEVTAPDGATGWLFGTVHSLPDGIEWRTPAFDQAWDSSGLLVVEIAELGDGDQAKAVLAERAHTPGLPPLSQRVAKGDRPVLRAFMDKAGLDDASFADTESWAAGLMLASAVRSADPANGVDRALLGSRKPRVGLESYDRQFAVFDRLPRADQADLLIGLAKEAELARGDAHIEAWLTGDLTTLESEARKGVLAYPNLADALLIGRNRNWLPQVEERIAARQRPFVAVGAAHMLGDAGLPALLAADGYTVRRVQ